MEMIAKRDDQTFVINYEGKGQATEITSVRSFGSEKELIDEVVPELALDLFLDDVLKHQTTDPQPRQGN